MIVCVLQNQEFFFFHDIFKLYIVFCEICDKIQDGDNKSKMAGVRVTEGMLVSEREREWVGGKCVGDMEKEEGCDWVRHVLSESVESYYWFTSE